MNIVVSLDGVLRSTVGGTVIREGRDLLTALKSVANIVLLTDDTEETAKRWLLQNRITSFDFIVSSSVDLKDNFPLRRRQVKVVLAKTGKVLLFVDHDPSNVAWAVSEGITSLLFVHPVFALPKNRPGSVKEKTRWSDIEKTYDATLDRNRLGEKDVGL